MKDGKMTLAQAQLAEELIEVINPDTSTLTLTELAEVFGGLVLISNLTEREFAHPSRLQESTQNEDLAGMLLALVLTIAQKLPEPYKFDPLIEELSYLASTRYTIIDSPINQLESPLA